jgi:hypothetical protein
VRDRVLDITISSSSRADADSVRTALQPVLASPSAATAFLAPVASNMTAGGTSILVVEGVVVAPSVSLAGQPQPSSTTSSTPTLLVVLLVAAGVLFVLCCGVLCVALFFFYRRARGFSRAERSFRLKETQLKEAQMTNKEGVSGKADAALVRPRDSPESLTASV